MKNRIFENLRQKCCICSRGVNKYFIPRIYFRIEATSSKRSELLTAVQNQGTALLDIKFCEKLDCLVAASQDSNIYLWGFETSAVDALCKLRLVNDLIKTNQYLSKINYRCTLIHYCELLRGNNYSEKRQYPLKSSH